MPKIKGKLAGYSHDEAKAERKKLGNLGSAKVVDEPSSVTRSTMRSKAMERSVRYPTTSRLHGREIHKVKDVSEYLGAKYPTASLRRAMRVAETKPVGKITPFNKLLFESVTRTARRVGEVRKKNQRRRRFGLFGLGLTAASLGSSIREAKKK